MAEADYPYEAVQGECRYDASKVIVKNGGQGIVEQRNEQALVEAIAEGPVAVAIDAGQPSFQMYKGGVYDEPNCKKLVLNHAVCAVGYGADESGVEYYIVRNSWGTSWGDKGYIYMVIDGNTCGVTTDPIYPTGVSYA